MFPKYLIVSLFTVATIAAPFPADTSADAVESQNVEEQLPKGGSMPKLGGGGGIPKLGVSCTHCAAILKQMLIIQQGGSPKGSGGLGGLGSLGGGSPKGSGKVKRSLISLQG